MLGLWATQNLVLTETRERDLNRVGLYARFSKLLLEADAAAGRNADETLAKIHRLGLSNAELLPLTAAPPADQTRVVLSQGLVEAAEVFNGTDGQPVGVVRFRRWDDTTRLALGTMRGFIGAFAFGGLLLIGFTWWALTAPARRRLRALEGKLRADFGLEDKDDRDRSAHPIDNLERSIGEAGTESIREAALRQRLLDGHEEAACLGTPDGTLREVNAAYCGIFGKTRAALVGSNYLDLIPPADRGDAVNSLRRLSTRHPVQVVEHRIVLPDGALRWMRWRDQAVFDDESKVVEVLSFGTDITAEKDLQDRLTGLRLAFDQMQSLAQTGSLTWDFAEDHMEWTSETFRLLGRRSGDGRPSLARLLESVVPEDRDAVRGLFESARSHGDAFEREFRVMIPGGPGRVVQSRAEVSADPKTKLLSRLTCTLRDITALREAESAMRRELRFREAIEHSLAAGIVVSDNHGKNLLVNPAFCEMTGWSGEELVGATAPYPYWPEEEIPAIRRAFESALAGQTPPQGYELRFCRKDGTRFDVLVKVAPLLDSNDKHLGWLAVVSDISNIQQTRRELARAEAAVRQELLYRQAIEKSTTAGLVAIDLKGRPISMNEAYCQMLGYSEEEIMAMAPPYPFWPDEEREKIEKAFAEHLAGNTPPEGFTLRFLRKDGTPVDLLITAAPIHDAQGRPIGMLSVLTDVTPLQQAQRQLREANERLQIAQDIAEFGIWDWDPVKDTLQWDRQSFAIFGHPDATDAEQVWRTVLSEEEQERLTYELRRLIAARGRSGQDRIRARWPDGALHDILSTYVILYGAGGRAARVVGINRDVTAELEEERELRDANERLAAALEGGQFGTFEHIIGVGDVNWSPNNYEINGIDPAVTDPAALFEAWKRGTGDFYPQLMSRMSALPVGEHHLTYEFTARPDNREPRRVRTSIFIERNKQGHPVRLVGITRRVD